MRQIPRNAERLFPPPDISSHPVGHSQHSQGSQALNPDYLLADTERDHFEKRAAFMEYEGGLDRAAAEALALLSVLACKRQK